MSFVKYPGTYPFQNESLLGQRTTHDLTPSFGPKPRATSHHWRCEAARLVRSLELSGSFDLRADWCCGTGLDLATAGMTVMREKLAHAF